jgi:hypothetical protein
MSKSLPTGRQAKFKSMTNAQVENMSPLTFILSPQGERGGVRGV